MDVTDLSTKGVATVSGRRRETFSCRKAHARQLEIAMLANC